MCHIFPCVMEKPAFPTRDAPIDKRNVFLLSRRAVSRCRHKSLHEKQVPTVFQIGSKFPNSQYLRKQIFKRQIVQIKRCTENHGVQLPLYILELSIFSCQPFCNSCSFLLFHFFALNYIFLLQILLSITFTQGSSTQYVRTKGEGRSQAKCIQLRRRGERVFKVVYVHKRIFFFGPENRKSFLFWYKRSYYIAIYYCVQKTVNRP